MWAAAFSNSETKMLKVSAAKSPLHAKLENQRLLEDTTRRTNRRASRKHALAVVSGLKASARDGWKKLLGNDAREVRNA